MASKGFGKRIYILIGLVVVIFGAFAVNLARVQLSGEKTPAETAVSTVDVDVSAARGEIVDRNGNALVINKQSNSIIFDGSFFPSVKQITERIEIIESLIKLFENNGGEWIDNLPLVFDASGSIMFVEDKDADIAFLKSANFLNLNSYATAQNCFDALLERYSLQNYDLSMARKIISVCYNMRRKDFSVAIPYTFAEDVSDELVAKIKENNSFYTGVDVAVTPIREYVDGTLAPHILGMVGVISAEEYAEKKDSGYGFNDSIGKSGIELALEDTLRGKNGTKTITTDADGNKTSAYTVEPQAGSTVMLTIDANMQKIAQDTLEETITKMQQTRPFKMSGSVVAIDVKNGEVLACATYPSYDATTYTDDYEQLASDKNAPLWNRALMTSYTPGSTIKLAVSMGALEEGIIDNQFTVTCGGRYYYYKDYQPSCLGVHGKLDVTHAIFNSCNIFFYETARLMGITSLNKYFSVFGLGTKTGVEINETEGNVDSVAYRESVGDIWTPGLTLQAGIGHGSNLFSPIQLCNYGAMVATRGTRYKAHFVKGVLSYDRNETIEETEPEVLAQVNFEDKNWDLVQSGMWLVANEWNLFKGVPVEVAAKTGTTTVMKEVNGKSVKTNNGLLICYAPYNDPQIAVCTVIEGAETGSSTSAISTAMMKYYFSDQYGSTFPIVENADADATTAVAN